MKIVVIVITIIIVCIVGFILGLIVSIISEYKFEVKEWNNGRCPVCGEKLILKEILEDGRRVYQCSKNYKDYTTFISFHNIDKL